MRAPMRYEKLSSTKTSASSTTTSTVPRRSPLARGPSSARPTTTGTSTSPSWWVTARTAAPRVSRGRERSTCPISPAGVVEGITAR